MSLTQSTYGERFFELDQSMSRKLDRCNALRQYTEAVERGEINKDEQSFEQWLEAGNYDKSDWSSRDLKEFGW